MIRALRVSSPKTLILGGGEGSLVYTIARERPHTPMDVVEINSQISAVALKYFLNTVDMKHIHWRIEDAFAFVQNKARASAKYDLIIVDVFDGPYIPEKMYQKSFASSLRTLLATHGVYVINFGSDATRFHHIRPVYAKTLKNFTLYRYGAGIVGTNGKFDPFGSRATPV